MPHKAQGTEADGLSLKGKRLDFYAGADTNVSLTTAVPELSRFTTCVDLVFTAENTSDWVAFSYITNDTFLGIEDIDLGLGGNHQQLILYKMGKIFYIHHPLTPLHWHTVCLIWDGMKGRLELFLNKERILVMMDQPQNLAPNGTLILGHLFKKGDSQVTRVVPIFSGSLYYFQLWDRILENEEFMKCLDGNIVSWEEDVWLSNKITPAVDTRLRCWLSQSLDVVFTKCLEVVSEDITIQTTHSQQIDLTTPSQIAALKPEKTAYSTVMPKSMSAFATNYATISYSNTTSSFLKTTTPFFLRTSTTDVATSAADILSTSMAITLPTQSTSMSPTTNSMKITKSPRTTKMSKTIATEIFHPTTMTNFLHTSTFTKNSITSKPSVTGSQSAAVKTTSLSSSKESSSKSTTSWPKDRSTDIGTLPVPTTSQEFLASAASGTVHCSTVEQTSATTTSAAASELVLTWTAPGDSIFPRNQTASTLATTDKNAAVTVYPVTLPAGPTEMTSAVRTAETESTSGNFQDVSSYRVEDTMSTFMPEETSSMSLSFRTSSPFVSTQSVQTVIRADTPTTRATFAPGTTLAPTVAETTLSLTITGPVSTQNTPTGDENTLPLLSTSSASISKVAESEPTSITDNGAHLFSTRESAWPSRPDQTLLTSAFHGSTSDLDRSSTTPRIFTPAETFTDSEASTATGATATGSDAATDRDTTVLSKRTSPWLATFPTVSETTSVTKRPECKLTTSPLKTTPTATVTGQELLSTPKGTVVPPVDRLSTVSDTELHFSTESASETTQTEARGTVAFGETTALAPESATTQRFSITVTKKETTSHYLSGKLTVAVTAEVLPSATVMEATDESAQVMTTSVPVSPFSDVENSNTSLDNAIATTEARGSWLSTKAMKTTSKSSYNGTTETFNSIHTYTAHRTSETPPTGNSTPSPTSESTQTFPEPLDASTAMISEDSFATNPASRTLTSLSAGTFPPQATATHYSATPGPIAHMSSLPVNNPAVTSVGVSKETKVTMPKLSTPPRASSTSVLSDASLLSSATVNVTSVPPLAQTSSTKSNTVSTDRDSGHTASEVTVISVRMTPTAVPSLTEAPVPSLTPLTPVAMKTEATLLSTSTDIVTPSTPTSAGSKSLPVNTPVVSSTTVISYMSTPVATQPISQVGETSTHAVSFPYTFSGGGDVVSLATADTTETSVVDENITSHSSSNKLTNSVDGHISQSSTHLVSLPVSTLLVTGISTLSSGKEDNTTKVTEASPSKNSFTSNSHSTLPLEMTDTRFIETTKISSHQSNAPSEIPSVTPPNGISVSSPTSGSAQTTPTLTLSHTVDVHSSETPTSLGKTTVPSHVLTITTFSSPENDMQTLSVYTPRTEKMTVSTISVTHPVSYHQDTSFIDTSIGRTNKITNPVNISPTVSHLLSPRTQPEVTSVVSPISENKQTSSEFRSPSTMGLSSVNFTMLSTDRTTTVLSAQNVPTTLVEKTSMTTSIPTKQMSSLPVNVTVFTSKRVSDPSPIQMTKSSKTAHTDCLKSPFIATSGSMSETSSIPVSDAAFSPPADTSTSVGSFSTSLSSIAPKTAVTIQTPTWDVTPGTFTGPSSKSTMVSSAVTTSEMREVSSRITPPSFSFPTEPTFPSLKTIPTTIVTGIFTPLIDTTASSPRSSKNTEAISSIPKSTFLLYLSTTQQPSQGGEATTLDILPGITNSSLSTVKSGGVTALTSSYSRTTAPESASPSFLEYTRFPIFDYLQEHSWIHKVTPSSLTSFLSSPHSAEAEISASKTLPPSTSQMAELPALGIRTTSSNTHSLFMTSWNTPTAKDSQFPISSTAHVLTPNKVETETPYPVPESLTTFTTSQTALVSGNVMEMSSISSSGILPTLGMSENPSLSMSLPKSTFLTSGMAPTHLFTNFTTLPFAASTTLTEATPSSAVGGITTNFSTSPPLSVRMTDDSIYISKSPEASSRTAATANSRTAPQPPSFSIMSRLPPTTGHTPPTGSTPLTNPIISAWSRIPVASVSPTLVLPTTALDSLPNITTATSMATGSSFLRISTGMTHRSTATGSSLLSSSLPTRLDSRSSFLSTETLTSPVAAESTVSFYNIKMSFSVFDEESSILITSVLEEISETWLNSIFQDSEFAIANLAVQIKSRCVCQVIIKANSSLPSTELISKIKSKIHGNFTQDQLTLSIKSEHVAVEKLEPGTCKADETASKYKGTYKWLLTNPTETAQTRCIKNEDGNAVRTCSISINNGRSQWEKPKLKQCKLLQELPDNIMDLANITISDENAEEVAEHILSLINESPPLDEDEIKIIVSKVSDISHCDEISMNLTQTVLQIINAVLGKQHSSAPELHGVNNEILRIIEHVGHKMEFSGRTANLTVARLALAVLRVDHTFEGTAFSIRSYKEGTDPEIYLGNVPLERVLASIYLPKSLRTRIPLSNLQTILFNFFGQTSLFKVKNATKTLTTYVVSASVSNISIQNLADPVVVTLQHIGGNQVLILEGKKENIRLGCEPQIPKFHQKHIIPELTIRSPLLGLTPEVHGKFLCLLIFSQTHTRSPCKYFKTTHKWFKRVCPLFENTLKMKTLYCVVTVVTHKEGRLPQIFLFSRTMIEFIVPFGIWGITRFGMLLSSISPSSLLDCVTVGCPFALLGHLSFYLFTEEIRVLDGQGGWNSSGCKVKETNVNRTVCQCDHLTHFGVLMDLSRSAMDAVNEWILTLITYIGCGISSIFLGVVMVTYIAFHKLRRDHPSKILINLCTALLLLNLVFLVNSWLSSFQKAGLCITTAVALHYSLLASLTWMGLEAVHMYFALIRVFNIYIPHYMLKFCLVGWGIPAIVVAIILAVNKDVYGTAGSTTLFCWIKDDSAFYGSVVAYFCLIFLMNLSTFCTVLAQLNSMKSPNQKTRQKIIHDLRGTMSLTFLLGLTWGFAFFAWGPVRILFSYLFAISNTLQGFFIFVFHCVMKESVREQWQIHLYCGWLRLDNSSDGISRHGLSVVYKQERRARTFQHKLLTPSLRSTATNSTFKTLGSAQGTPSEICFPNGERKSNVVSI
ncbi:Adhesion G-protein coupled receptor G4 [Galemys pyrenaicus]|uniref:Adhesion G-protein coupled receptor G4 n=1 Tax=Galemys pyrenaicus TaxID=202257 RepID=A0A8J5ZYM3_GALPY|nr:Adhesion G-protein coupled receptor G4 [Galemys pyrenaicus]